MLAATAVGVAAGLSLAIGSLVAAALLLQLKTLLDNTDGGLARLSGRVSMLGRYLDTESDTVLNAFLFAVLGATTGNPWLALAAFCALTAVLSVNFNLAELYRQAHGEETEAPARSGSRSERALELGYRWLFKPQDRLIRVSSARRLARALQGVEDADERRAGTLAYHDRLTLAVLGNLGLSTQLAVLGLCLLLGVPELYLWLALASFLPVPVLQLRRERLARATRRRAV